MEEAGEEFQQKQTELQLQEEELASLREADKLFRKEKEQLTNEIAELHRELEQMKAMAIEEKENKGPKYGQSNHGCTQVESTCGTPYKAMHTKSSLLRLQNVMNSPAKREKCLDHSCFVNDSYKQKVSANARKRKSRGLGAETRSTKRRRASTKNGVCAVIKRVYEPRSRTRSKAL